MKRIILAGLLLGGCAVPVQPIDVTPDLVKALATDGASACAVLQVQANAAMYGGGNTTSTYCRTGVPTGSVSVDRTGTITITHGPQTGLKGDITVLPK